MIRKACRPASKPTRLTRRRRADGRRPARRARTGGDGRAGPSIRGFGDVTGETRQVVGYMSAALGEFGNDDTRFT